MRSLYEKLNRLDDSIVESTRIVKKKKLTEDLHANEYKVVYYDNTAGRERRPETAKDVDNDWHEVTFRADSDLDAWKHVFERVCGYDVEEFFDDNASEQDFFNYFDSSDWGDGSLILLQLVSADNTLFDTGYTKKSWAAEFVEGIDEMLTESEEKHELSTLVKDSINHLVNDLGKDPMADDFGDDVCADLENTYDLDVPQNPVKYVDWCDAVMSEVSRQLNKLEGQLTESTEKTIYSVDYYEPKLDKWIRYYSDSNVDKVKKYLNTPMIGNPMRRLAEYKVTGVRNPKYTLVKELDVSYGKQEDSLTEGNNVNSQLPTTIDSFLQDIAQIYETIDYTDIMHHNYSEEDIRKLKNLRRRFRAEVPYEGDEEADAILQDIAEKVAKIVKNNMFTEQNILKDEWQLIKSNKTYDPEGLDINPTDEVLCSGTEEKCREEFNKLVTKFKMKEKTENPPQLARVYRYFIKIEKLTDDTLVVYYPQAQSKDIYRLRKVI